MIKDITNNLPSVKALSVTFVDVVLFGFLDMTTCALDLISHKSNIFHLETCGCRNALFAVSYGSI